MALMMFDTRFTMYDNYVDKIASGEYFIIDGKGFTFRYFFEIAKNASTLRAYMKYIQEVSPFNIKGLHIVNCSSVLEKMFALIRPVLKMAVIKVMHFHPNGLGNLHKYLCFKGNTSDRVRGTFGSDCRYPCKFHEDINI